MKNKIIKVLVAVFFQVGITNICSAVVYCYDFIESLKHVIVGYAGHWPSSFRLGIVFRIIPLRN